MDLEKLYTLVENYDNANLKSQEIWEKINDIKPKEMHYLDFQELIEQIRLDNKLIEAFKNEKPYDCKSLLYRGASKEYLYKYFSKLDKSDITDTQNKLISDLQNKSKAKFYPYAYDQEICNVRVIDKKEFDRLVNKLNNKESFTFDETDNFLLIDDDMYIAIDNKTGNMWTEEFKEKEYAIRYLQGESIDKIRDEECKYEICIYETEEDYNEGEPFQLDVYSNLEDAKTELKHAIEFNNYFSGNIINQQNGMEEYAYYLNKEEERYSHIFECTLKSHLNTYEHQFLLVKNPNDLETNFEIDLKGSFEFNCDYEVINPKLVQVIKSKEELQEFCQKHNIKIPEECIRNDGIVASGPDGLLINDELQTIDWIENIEEEEVQ